MAGAAPSRAAVGVTLAALALLAGVVLWRRLSVPGGAADLGAGLGRAVGDGAAGVVMGLGESFGLPRTDPTTCAQARAAGDTLAASLYCPAADGVAAVVEGIGGAVGVPRTDTDACARAKAAGDGWRASFDCPAADFLAWQWSRITGD